MWIGIDFGTTHSVAALYDGNRLAVLPLDPIARNPRTVRTVLYIEKKGSFYIGREAIKKYYEQNSGRVRNLKRQYAGTVDINAGSLGVVYEDIFVYVDEGMPGRLLHSLKGVLATEYQGTEIFGNYYSIERLVALFLDEIRSRICKLTKNEINGIVLGRPVNFAEAEQEEHNIRAQTRLLNAAEMAGFQNISFEFEPVAAGLSFLEQNTFDKNYLLIFDFGGGTLDVSVILVKNGEHTVLSTGGVGIGGDMFDKVVMERLLLPWFGKNVKWNNATLPFPSKLIGSLLEWQDIPTLYTPSNLSFFQQLKTDCTDPMRIFALEELISKDYGFSLFEEIETQKIALSSKPFSILSFEKEAINIWQPITRSQFEKYLSAFEKKVREIIFDTLDRSSLKANQIDLVVRTGGSSEIPFFQKLLETIFDSNKIFRQDAFTGVASGLAVSAYYKSLR